MRGISFEIMIWPGVTPGVKTLWFNGQPIQFDITIADYPGAEPPGD
jgi:hypothetical protein